VDLREYISLLRRRWLLIASVTVLALLAATAATMLTTPRYESRTQLFVSTQGGSNSADLAQGSSFSQQRVKSYAEIVTSPLVLGPVIDKLGLDTTPAELGRSVTADAPLDTVLIDVAVRDASPVRAERIAAAIGTQFSATIVSLEQPLTGDRAPVRATVVQASTLPTSPVTPRVPLNLALGLLVGLALGVAAAVLRSLLDTSVRSEADVREVTGAAVLGAIAYDPDAAKRPLIVQADPHGARAEAFRQLRTNLQFVELTAGSRSIVFTSSVPDEGKSTTTANLALTLAAAGSTVALVEGDLRRPKVADYLGLEGAVGLTDVLIGQAELDDVLQPWGDGTMQVLACGTIPPNPSELLASDAMRVVLAELATRFDHILVDAPPLLPVTDAAILSRLVGGVVVVVGAKRVHRDGLRRALESLASVDARILGTVVNRLPTKGPDAQGYGYGYGYGYGPDAEATGRRGHRRVPGRALVFGRSR